MAVLGALLQKEGGREALAQTAAILPDAHYFSLEEHQEIFAAALDLRRREVPVDLITLAEELRRRGKLEKAVADSYLASLHDGVGTAANVGYHARIVLEAADHSALVESLGALHELALKNGQAPEALRAQVRDRLLPLCEVRGVESGDATIGSDAFLTTAQDLAWDICSVRIQGDHGWTGGAPKSMKSLLSLEEARALATGSPFLGHFPARRCRVLYVSEEDRRERLHRRVHAMFAGRPAEEIPGPDDLRFLIKAGVRLHTPEGVEVLRRHLQRWRPAVVFVEHFDKLHAHNPNDPAAMRPLLDVLDRLHQEHGCTFRIQKHERKQAAGQSKRKGEMLAGTVALFGWGESSIYLTLLRRGLAMVEVEAKDGDTAGRFLVEYRDGRLVYVGEAGAEGAAGRREKAHGRLLEYLGRMPDVTAEDLAEALKASVKTVKRHLGALEAAGQVVGQQEMSRQPKRWRLKPAEAEG